jgi:hypothetical protein
MGCTVVFCCCDYVNSLSGRGEFLLFLRCWLSMSNHNREWEILYFRGMLEGSMTIENGMLSVPPLRQALVSPSVSRERKDPLLISVSSRTSVPDA